MPAAHTIDLRLADGVIRAGSSYQSNTPGFEGERGLQPDLFLAWNDFGVHATALDVVLYFHGFAIPPDPRAALSGFVEVSGLASARSGVGFARRPRPTLAIVPRGNARTKPPPPGEAWPYDFPAMIDTPDLFIARALDRMAAERRALDPSAATTLGVDRLLLMAHSGGGRAVLDVLPRLASPPSDVILFDALYHDPDPHLTDWVASTLQRADAEDCRLWVGYLRGTGPFSVRLQRSIDRLLKAARPERASALATRFTVAKVTETHMDIPRTWAPRLLSDALASPPVS